jgi:hypothetical protein
MKKAYNELWVENFHIQKVSESWLQKKLITSDQNNLIKVTFPQEFYLPGIFVRIGLFIFGMMGCSFFTGFISMFFSNGAGNPFLIPSLFSSLVFIYFLEFLIKDRKLFHSGIDNALLYCAVVSLLIPIVIYFEDRLDLWQYCLITLVVLVIALYRYADTFLAGCTYLTLLTLLGNLMIGIEIGKALLPFALMALAVTINLTLKYITNLYFLQCRKLLQILTLLTIYLAGNYHVVREANAILNNTSGSDIPQISYASLFYFFTAVIPITYILLGLKKKDRILLVTGLVCWAFSLFTLQYYSHFLTTSQAISVVGAFMIATASLLIHYLKQPKFGLSDVLEADNHKILQLQTLLAAEYLNISAEKSGFEFGGEGKFSGGGGGGEY